MVMIFDIFSVILKYFEEIIENNDQINSYDINKFVNVR